MRMRRSSQVLFGCLPFSVLLLAVLASCSDPMPADAGAVISDADLQARVQTVLANATDLPGSALQVEVNQGQVTIRGSLDCADCGGTGTPAGSGTVQQSLGAVVRAVPGVTDVVFQLQ